MTAVRTAALYGIVISELVAHAAGAAEIKSISSKDGRVAVSIVGEIMPGDADTFTAVVKQANDAGRLVANVRLNSIGGNLLD
jgi:membrane-bound ClpP family serine protease